MATNDSKHEPEERTNKELTEQERVKQSDKVVRMEREEPWPDPPSQEDKKKE
ncbi:MAG: hypothetical protein WAO35_02885 [Terriglobia bacterium]